jgi:hypothetical protein
VIAPVTGTVPIRPDRLPVSFSPSCCRVRLTVVASCGVVMVNSQLPAGPLAAGLAAPPWARAGAGTNPNTSADTSRMGLKNLMNFLLRG